VTEINFFIKCLLTIFGAKFNFMKNVISFKLLVYCSLILILISCNNNNKEIPITNEDVIVCGKITNPTDSFIVICDDTIKVQSDGQFYTKRKFKKLGYCKLYYNNEYTNLYIENGDSLYITFDTKQFHETMHYTGKGSEKNNYLATCILNKKLEQKALKPNNLYQLEPNNFRYKLDSIKNTKLSVFKRFLDTSSHHISEKFKKFEESKIIYTWASTLLRYPLVYEYNNKSGINISDAYYSFLKDINIEDTNLVSNLREYDEFIQMYISYLVNQKYKQDTSLKTPYIVLSYNVIKEKISNYKLKEYLLYNNLLNEIQISGINENTDSLLNDYKLLSKNNEHIKKIQEEYSKWVKLAKGNTAPDIKLVDNKGDTILLSSFKGKYVYIDVWATWCGPCRMEMPHFDKLKEKFKNKNITFVSVSVDHNIESWKKFIKEKSMKGNQYIAIGGFGSDIVQKYNIYTIPRFILIDKEGKIINVNAPRPSSKEIHEVLTSLI